VVLFFVGGLDDEEAQSRIWAFDALLPDFGRRRVQLLGVVPTTARRLREATGQASVTLLADGDGTIRAAYAGEGGAGDLVAVIDRRGTLVAVLGGADDAAPMAVLGAVDGLLDRLTH
jgi:peroxiredoxin